MHVQACPSHHSSGGYPGPFWCEPQRTLAAAAQVWDRRALRGTRPAGVLIGHTEGITHLDPKNDGRYLLSNCKDQTARLWDIRKVPAPCLCTLHSLKVFLRSNFPA